MTGLWRSTFLFPLLLIFSSPVIRRRIQEGESHKDGPRIDEIIPI